jgi:beta-lactamase regulating signal transducer with metallopeptidase domain
VNAALLFAAKRLWQSSLAAAAAGLLVMALLLIVALRKNHAQARHWVWMIASVKFLIPCWLFTSIGSHLEWLKTSAAPAGRLSLAVEGYSLAVWFGAAPACCFRG